MRATKLVCTLGPASAGLIGELVAAGMDVARVNLSHGTRDDHVGLLASVRRAGAEAERAVAVVADLSGPKVRLGELREGRAELEDGRRFVLRPGGGAGDASGAAVDRPSLGQDLEPGDRVLLSDGAVELVVVESRADVITEVVRGGTIRSRAGVNVPSERLSGPAITPKDRRDLSWALEAGVDAVAQSFVRSAEEVAALRSLLGEDPPLLLVKIETRGGVEDSARIAEAADALILARGDLGVEMPLEEIPVIQRTVVATANRAGVPAIIATQMLESMTAAPRPTRAEVEDVASAVFDGADGILLSGETAIGRFPVETARTAARILEAAETKGAGFISAGRPHAEASDPRRVARAAAGIAREGGVAAVACFTSSGLTARLLAAERPGVAIVAFSPDERVVRRLALYRGVLPLGSDQPDDTDGMIAMMDRRLTKAGLGGRGDTVVMVAATPIGWGATNMLKVHRLEG